MKNVGKFLMVFILLSSLVCLCLGIWSSSWTVAEKYGATGALLGGVSLLLGPAVIL